MWRASRLQTSVLIVLVILVFYLFFLSLRDDLSLKRPLTRPDPWECPTTTDVQELSCLIEGTRRLSCLKRDDEVYMPFYKFIQKQFQVTGKLDSGAAHFEYYTSYSRTRVPDSTTYNPFGAFGHFASYNVEMRERVRCINTQHAVPMSTQWNNIPYFYPIQIAQFALQHYSRFKTEPEPKVIKYNLTTSIKINDANKSVRPQHSIRFRNDSGFINVLFTWQPASANSWFAFDLELTKIKLMARLTYRFLSDERCVWAEQLKNIDNGAADNKMNFVYALGALPSANHTMDIMLDLGVDALKAIATLESKPTAAINSADLKSSVVVKALHFYGAIRFLSPIRLQNVAHRERFDKAVEWLVRNQNSAGGWPVPTQRSIADDRLMLRAGWHSAMAQGHAMSVLVRVFHLNAQPRYVEAVRAAFRLFRTNVSEGGVVNELFGNPWYEEYPTTPGTFVLNGFIYALIGIYDATAIPELEREAMQLFKDGIASLKMFLPLYDSGSGSIYDLRHIALKTAPNLARWDYHAVHIYLLKWLFNITGDKQFNDVADRWIDYAHGQMAKHN